MRLEHYSENTLKRQVRAIVGKHLDLNEYKIFFFGSRVKGNRFPRSDIDIGIKGPKPVNSKAWLEIKEAIENLPTLYKVDIVDFRSVSPTFRKVALRHVEYIEGSA
ncbi:MAG: nucleotidyltransferase domain-containing protein [Elusimicrobia bacterium]|nr:nucleotidyltransferase domain-containing protein [Elusimicrobiota bacterium]